MDIYTAVSHLVQSGFIIHYIRNCVWEDGIYQIEMDVTNVDKLGQNVISIFNSFGWNVQVIHFYENGLYVEFVVKQEEFKPPTYVETQ